MTALATDTSPSTPWAVGPHGVWIDFCCLFHTAQVQESICNASVTVERCYLALTPCIFLAVMKLLRTMLIVTAVSALAVISQAQNRFFYHWYPVFTNYVSNPGFESGYTPWDRSLSYHETDDIVYMNLGSINSDAHSGTHGMDMNVGEGGYNGFYHSEIRQTLSTPIAVNSLWDASIWCQSSGNDLNMTVTYTDNTQSWADFYVDSFNATPGNNGFVQWNFFSDLTPGKTVKAIDFNADSFSGGDVVIDDVSLTTLTWIFIG